MRLWTLLLAAALVGCEPKYPQYDPVDWHSQAPPAQHEVDPQHEPYAYEVLLKLHNDQRGYKGRGPLEINQQLNQYAQDHAEWMARRYNLKHSNVGNIMKFGFHTAGENIAMGQRSEQEAVQDWMNSSGHRANILNRNFTHAGFGLAEAHDGTKFWCAVFAG